MIAQRHRIRRQVLEVHAPGEVASEIQNELSQIQRQQLEPIIDECCSELSSPDRIHRIDRLEVDLGNVSLQGFEIQLRQALKSALHKALQSRIEMLDREACTSDQHPAAKSQLELVAFFASTGTLPWWADSNRPRHLRESIDILLEHAADDLAVLLRELTRHPRQFQRILLNCEDATLIALFKVLLLPESGPSQIGQQLGAIVRSHLFLTGHSSAHVRTLFWSAVLTIAALPIAGAAMYVDGTSFAPDGRTHPITSLFWVRVFAQMAKNSPEGYATIVSAVIQLARTSEPGLSEEMREGLFRAAFEVERRQPENLPKEVVMELARLFPKANASTDMSESFPQIRNQTDAPERGEVRDSPYEAELDSGAGSLRKDLPRATGQTSRKQVRKEEKDDRTDVFELAFSDADSVYIENSGLVILWLFLERFFERLHLLKGSNFKDAAARHRAAGLLQYIVTEDTSPPEYQMTLNKLMCGMGPEEMLDFGPVVTEVEEEACVNLISAVIENAPILRNMSHNGLRGSFLLRKGVLSAGEANWILRVERETFDVVLDRFPWTFSWVKLPWMEIPLGVEW